MGFLSGVLAYLDGLRDARISWLRDAVWAILESSQRLEVGGLALIAVSCLISIVQRRN